LIARLKAAWQRHPLLTSGFILALLAAGFFAMSSAFYMVYWSDPTHRSQPIEGWMTPRYIATSWKLPREVMTRAIDPVGMPEKMQTLNEIAAQQGITVDELVARITAAAEAFRSENQ
jgi:hypothetical protein